MSGHEDWCDKVDDPRAVDLWRSGLPSVLEVHCGVGRHRLAAVYDVSDLGGRVLCQPYIEVLQDHLEEGQKRHAKDAVSHWHAAVEPLDALPTNALEFGRCRCGVWSFSVYSLRLRLELPAPKRGPRVLTADRRPSTRNR